MVLVDATQSQLHLLEKRQRRWRRLSSWPVAVGRKGVGKTVEGDQRTPLGIYEIIDRRPGEKLPRIYGPGALVLNYPSYLDKRDGRTGSNIWIHGMDPDRASAPERSSSGCLVLANPHVEALMDLVGAERTTVLIARKLEWVHPTSADPEGRILRRRLAQWKEAREAADVDLAWQLYSERFANVMETPQQWRSGMALELDAIGPSAREIRDLSILAWNETVRQVTFTETLKGMSRGLTHRQYWSAEDGEWRIFSEGVFE